MERLRIGLIGAGGFGANHLEAIGKLQADGLMELVAIADPFVETLREVKAEAESRGVRWFLDYREMLSGMRGHLDAVAIATPIPLHLPMVEAAMNEGLAVYLEKPPIPLLQDFLKMMARPEARRVAVGFHLVADPLLRGLKKAMIEGRLGRVESISGTACWPRYTSYYERAGWAGRMYWKDMAVFDGPATNALAHVVHNVMYLGGETAASFALPEEVRGEVYRARKIESYDLCCLTGNWASETRFQLALAHCAKRRDNWEIVVRGEKGTARIGNSGAEFQCGVDLGEELAPSPIEAIRDLCWRDFHAMATSAAHKPFTSLADCHAYVAATNAMLLSSGGIHQISREYCEEFAGEDYEGIVVEDVNELVASVRERGSFAEQGVDWAVPGGVVNARSLCSIPFAALSLSRDTPF